MLFLVDSDWIVDSLRGIESATTTLERLLPSGCAVSIISVAELYEGAYAQDKPQAHLEPLRTFLGAFTVLNLSDGIVDQFARIRSRLRREGTPVPDFDLLIGATALRHDLTSSRGISATSNASQGSNS